MLDRQFPELAIGDEFSENLVIAVHPVDHEAVEGFLEDVAEVVLVTCSRKTPPLILEVFQRRRRRRKGERSNEEGPIQ